MLDSDIVKSSHSELLFLGLAFTISLSNTALDIFGLDGMTPETKMSVETSDITNFCEFGWYQWVYFRDTSVTSPGDKSVLGRYCGPSIDVGPELTTKILRNNG